MTSYGDTSTIVTRTGASAEAFGFDTEAEFESFVDDLRERASSEVDRYTGVRWELFENHVDVVKGTGRRHLSTRNDPVREIHSVREGSRELVEDDDYRLLTVEGNPDENIGRLERIDGRWRPHLDVEIEYDFGYTEANRPLVIDGVVEDMVVAALNAANAERKADGLESESMDGFSASYALQSANDRLQLTESMRERLKPLRRMGVA